jgi:hypothetical protein
MTALNTRIDILVGCYIYCPKHFIFTNIVGAFRKPETVCTYWSDLAGNKAYETRLYNAAYL